MLSQHLSQLCTGFVLALCGCVSRRQLRTPVVSFECPHDVKIPPESPPYMKFCPAGNGGDLLSITPGLSFPSYLWIAPVMSHSSPLLQALFVMTFDLAFCVTYFFPF